MSLKLLFFNNTNKPNPALDKSPLIIAPKEIVPLISIIVKPIDTAQLGIKPTKAAITAMDKDPTIVDCDLKNHKGNQKRPLIHAKRSKAKNLKQHRALCKAA